MKAPRTWAELQRPGVRRPHPTARRLVILVVVLAVVGWSLYPLKIRFGQRREINEARKELKVVKAENQALEGEVQRLATREYVELMARENFGWVRPGEEAYLVASTQTEPVEVIDPARGRSGGAGLSLGTVKKFFRYRY